MRARELADQRRDGRLAAVGDLGVFGQKGQEAGHLDLVAETLLAPDQQAAARHHGAASGDQVVNQQHALSGLHRIGVQFHCGAAVLQLIGFFHGGERQLAFFADRHKTQTQLISDHRAQDETACIEARDHRVC